MAKKKQLKIDINNAIKGKTYDLKNISDIYITYDSNLQDCLDMSVSGSTLTMKVSGNVVVYKFTNITDSMPIKVYHSNGEEKFNGTLQEFYSTYDLTPVDYSYTTKKNVITGTALSDEIDVHDKNYKGKGFTINAGAGDDEITGTLFADTISGGVGNNIINYTKGDGNDIINLTNKENLLINMSSDESVYSIDDLRFAYANKNKDLRIYTDKDSNAEFITLKNFAKKDVTGTGSVLIKIGGKTYNLETSQNVTDPKNPVDIVLYKTTLTGKGSNVTGTWLNEVIDASAVEGRTQKVKKQVVDVSTNKGLTLNGGAGNDTITGSKYSDTINGGNGNDIIYASNGNDGITGGKGTNTLIYSTTDFGKDTITLTKGETLNITGLVYKEGKTLATSCSKSGNNLLIDTEHGQVVLKNFYTKNTGATVNVDGMNLSEVNLLAEVNAANYFEIPGKKLNAKYTGTALADIVNASGLSKQTAKGGVGVTINTGHGADEVTGSNFKDTINTGDGNDTINGSLGADKLTGGTGENEIIYTTLAQLDGDTINLAKNEKLDICVNVAGATATYKVSGKNLVVTVNDGNETKSFTIANFGTKDITTSNGAVNLILNGADPVDLRTVTLTELNVTKNYTGTFHADNINAAGATKGLTLNGGAGDDIIVGSALKDTIKGGAGDDTITGGVGNDNLYGEGGSNTFIFNNGDDNDILYSGKGTDTLRFVDANDLTFAQGTGKAKTDLIIKYNYVDDVAQDSVTIKNYFDKKGKVVSSVKFAEILGKTYDIETLRTYVNENGELPVVVNEDYNHPEDNTDKVIIADNTTDTTKTITTGNGNNTIYASENNPTNIVAGNGDNEVFGGNGGTITTGTGDDVIHSGNSTSINAGSGENEIHLEKESNTVSINTTNQDNPTHNTIIFEEKQEEGNTIVFEDKTLEQVETNTTFHKDGNDLVIVQDENNTTTLTDYLNQGNVNISETTIKGSGEDTKTLTEIINEKGVEVTASETGGITEGTQYNDNIQGSANADIIYTNAQDVTGGTGSNVINAGSGDDEIHLQESHNEIHIGSDNGKDTLIIEEHQENGNTIVFDDKTLENIQGEGTTLIKDGNDLVIQKDENNSVTIQDYFNENNQQNISETTIKGSGDTTTTLTQLMEDKGIEITGSENIEGTNYKDNITGSEKGDLINGGAGNDEINGVAGNNVLIGGAGNDTLTGGTGNNTFIFNEGDGKDTITDATNADTIKLEYTPENEPTYSISEQGNLVIKFDDDNTITANFDYADSENNIDTILVKDETQPSGYKEISILEDVKFEKTISTNDTGYEKTTPYSENITIAEGVTGVSVSGLNENDSIQVAVDDEQQPTFTRTDNGGLVISGINDNAVTVTDFFTNGEDITVNGNSTEDITVNVTLTGTLEGTYTTSAYDENISGSGYVEKLKENDKILTTGDATYSRTNNGGLEITGTDTKTIVVEDFNFDGNHNINVNEGTTQNMTVNVTLEDNFSYTSSGYNENISGKGSVTGLGVNDKIVFEENADLSYTLTSNGLAISGGADTITVTDNHTGDLSAVNVYTGAVQDDVSEKTLTVSGVTNFDGSDLNFATYTITGTNNADTLTGGAGADTITSGKGADVISGGAGNDTIIGNADGNKTFIFNENDGDDHITNAKSGDIIQINTTATPVITKITEDTVEKLQIAYDGGTIVTNYDFASSANVDSLKFKKADGSYQTISISENISLELTGTNGVDNLAPELGQENYNYIITGGKGNDTLKGGTKNNTFIFALGDGNDTILHSGGTDTLVFEEGTTILTAKDGNNMVITYKGIVDETPVSNTITVTNYYTTQNHSVKYFKVGNTTYDFKNYYCLSRGDEPLTDLTVKSGSPVLLTLLNPFNGEDYKYTFTTDSTTAQTLNLQYYENGRLLILGDNLNVAASSNQADDIILWGDYNNVETGDGDDIIRVGGAIDGYAASATGNIVSTGSGNDHVTIGGTENIVDTGSDTDSVLDFTEHEFNTITNAEFNRAANENEPYSSQNGTITTFNQGNNGDCRVLSIIESLNQKGAFSDSVTITADGDDYTVRFNNYTGATKQTTVTKAEIEAFDGVYGDIDVVLTDIAINKLIKINGEGNYARNRSYAETATYNVLANYFFGSTDMAVAQSASNDYQTRIQAFWGLYQAGTVKNINVGFVMEDDIPELGIITGHSYSIKNLDTENGVITLVNPWDNKDVVNLDLTTFYGLEANVYIYGYKYNNENYTINNLWAYNDASGNVAEHSNATTGDDTIYGGEVGDNINALAGDDKIYGGYGNDTLTGGAGSDQFIFSTGDGKDTITDASSADKVVFTNNSLSLNSITFARGSGESTSLFVTYGSDPCDDVIEIQNYFVKSGDDFIMRDGTIETFVIGGRDRTLEWRLNAQTGEWGMYPKATVVNGTDGDDTYTSTSENEIFNLKKGNDTITFGAEFGDDEINANAKDWVINQEGSMNKDILKFTNHSVADGTLDFDITKDGDLVINSTGGSVTVNNFASPETPSAFIYDKNTDTTSENSIKLTSYEARGFYASKYKIDPQAHNNNAYDHANKSISTDTYPYALNTIFAMKGEDAEINENKGKINVYSEISSLENKHVFATLGGIDMDYWHQTDMADDTCITYDGDDNYEVFNITNDTKLRIKDTGGTDSITVRDDRLERLRLLFNVNADGTYDNVNMKIVRNDMITSDNFKSVYNSDTLGIRVTANADSESNGEGIEKILAAGHSVNNVTEWKDAIAGAVRTWLTNPANNFTDVEDALAHGSAAQITELYNLFNADYTATLASRVVSNIQTYQPFVYGSYTSYCTRAFGTDEAENIELINARGDDYRIYTGEGDDTVKLAGQRFNYFNQLYFGQTSSIFFKPGDDNDTITNSDTLANGVVVGDYTNEDQIDYAEKVFHGTTNSGNTSLYFKDVAPNNLTATRDGNDIILRYGENDSVRIENGYYSTNIGNITTYTADFNPLQEEQKTLGYYTYEDGVFTFHHSDYNEFTSVKQWNEYGNQLDDIPVYVETGSMKLSELFTNTIDNSEAAIAQTALGWIWNDNITASSHGDTIYGHNGNDTITGGAGNDIIYGGYGNDTINGGAGDDIIYGGEEHGIANSTWNTEQSDIIYGGEGNDRIYSAATYNDTSGLVWAKSEIYGGAGNDAISGAGHIDGGTGDDFIKLNRAMSYSTPDTVIGGAGNDTIVAHGSSGMLVNIDAGEGNDTLLTSTNYYDSDEGNEIERIDLRNNGYQPTLMGTVDMGAGRDHVAIASTAELTVDGGVDDDVIEVAAPQYISDFKTIVIKNSGGHDAVNLVSTRKTFNFNYHGEPLWDSDEQAYVVKKTFAPVAFFDMEINTSTGAITSTGTDIYICTTAPNRYVEESDLTYIGDKNNSIKFENGLVADHDFDIYIKNDESVGPFDYGSNYHYKGGYRILNIDYLKNAYAAKLKELGYSSMTAALSEVDADKLQANKEALAAIGMSEDAWVYTLDRPTEFSLGNFYDGDGSGQYYKDFGSGTGDENNLVTNFMRGMNHPLDEFFGGTDAKEFIYSTLNGDDIIRAGGGDDVIYGGRGNDQIYAGEGNNRIVFANHYYLYGSQVDHYNSPPYGQWYTINESTENGTTDGHDIVYSNGGTDTLDFMENDMVKFDKNGRDLVISYAFEAQEVDEELTDVATATVTVKDYFLANGDIDENHSAKYIKFKNRGVVALADEYNARNDAAYVWGTNEGEGLQGVYVYGGSGNDSLSAQGYGHDAYYLDGGEGSDTYSVDATSQNTQVIISDSGYTKGDIYLTNTHKTEFRAFYDVSATKDGDTVTTKLGDNLHIFDSSSGYSANGGIIVSLGYQNLLDENFDTSGYDLEVKVNNSKQYDGGYTIYSHELNGHYHTSSISSIVQQTQSWLADNYDACVAILGEGNVSTTNLMANTSADAAELKDSLLTQVNNNIYWS